MTSFEFPASLTTGSGVGTVTAFDETGGRLYQANEYHPHWNGILEGLTKGDPNVWELFDVLDGVRSRFKQVTDRVSFDGETVLFDGDPVHSVLSEQLSRAIFDGNVANYRALALFWEKLESNPSKHSRDQAYEWLATHKFQITEDGDVVGYKYVNRVNDGTFTSVHASTVKDVPSGYVNGTPVEPMRVIPQKVGDVVTMPRSEVDENPRASCSRGLHVGTFGYVGGCTRPYVLEVHVNPRDFVAIPQGESQKARVCRYLVAAVASQHSRSEAPVLRKDSTHTTWTPDVGTRV